MRSVFIADLHLKISEAEEPYQNFLDFITCIEKEYDALYILGDLFAYWYEHEGVDFYSRNPALKALKNLKSKGKKVYFIYGNRDFTVGDFFKRYTNVDYIGNEYLIDLSGRKIYLTHGDKFAKNDIRYQIWSKFIRSKIAKYVFKKLPVGYAISIADKFKNIGKNRQVLEKVLARTIINGAVSAFKTGYDDIITGHAHLKVKETVIIDGREKNIYILPEFKFPGEFLILEDNELKFMVLS